MQRRVVLDGVCFDPLTEAQVVAHVRAALRRRTGLRIAGYASPRYGFDRDRRVQDAVCRAVVDARPDMVFVGLGFPKQDWLIGLLHEDLPYTWFLGCGAAVGFVAGERRRAPRWLQ